MFQCRLFRGVLGVGPGLPTLISRLMCFSQKASLAVKYNKLQRRSKSAENNRAVAQGAPDALIPECRLYLCSLGCFIFDQLVCGPLSTTGCRDRLSRNEQIRQLPFRLSNVRATLPVPLTSASIDPLYYLLVSASGKVIESRRA